MKIFHVLLSEEKMREIFLLMYLSLFACADAVILSQGECLVTCVGSSGVAQGPEIALHSSRFLRFMLAKTTQEIPLPKDNSVLAPRRCREFLSNEALEISVLNKEVDSGRVVYEWKGWYGPHILCFVARNEGSGKVGAELQILSDTADGTFLFLIARSAMFLCTTFLLAGIYVHIRDMVPIPTFSSLTGTTA